TRRTRSTRVGRRRRCGSRLPRRVGVRSRPPARAWTERTWPSPVHPVTLGVLDGTDPPTPPPPPEKEPPTMDTPTPAQRARLPLWAQQHIDSLEAALDQRDPGVPTTVASDPHALLRNAAAVPVYLDPKQTIRFALDGEA